MGILLSRDLVHYKKLENDGMIALNSFQIKCKEELLKKLEQLGISIPNFSIKIAEKKWFAEEEIFIEASISDIKIWIYEDGAHIRGRSTNMPFEAPDYKNEEALINAFTENIIALLREEKHEK